MTLQNVIKPFSAFHRLPISNLSSKFDIPAIITAMAKPLPKPDDQSLETDELCKLVLQEMRKAGISRGSLGENILCRSGTAAGIILARPKPWDELNHRGKEVFRRLLNWWNLGGKIRVALCRLTKEEVAMVTGLKNGRSTGPEKRSHKPRTVFTKHQKKELMKVFCKDQSMPPMDRRIELAKSLNLEEKIVSNFFKNCAKRLMTGHLKPERIMDIMLGDDELR